jgi:hypothetical protein
MCRRTGKGYRGRERVQMHAYLVAAAYNLLSIARLAEAPNSLIDRLRRMAGSRFQPPGTRRQKIYLGLTRTTYFGNIVTTVTVVTSRSERCLRSQALRPVL